MELGSTIVGIIIITLSLTPFILMAINGKKRKNAIKKELELIAGEHNSKINQFDIWKKTGIALDEQGKYLIGYRKTNLGEQKMCYTLSDFSNCRIIKSSRDDEGNTVIESLKMEFVPKNHTKKPDYFEFFNINTDNSQLSDEFSLLDKWSVLLKSKF